MGILVGSNFDLATALPMDAKMVRTSAGDLASVPFVYNGLETFVSDTNTKYRYQGGVWVQLYAPTLTEFNAHKHSILHSPDGTKEVIFTDNSSLVTVNGSVNLPTGSTYRINGVNLNCSHIGAEPALGNPSVGGYILSSTADGIRVWIPASQFQDHSHGAISNNGTFYFQGELNTGTTGNINVNLFNDVTASGYEKNISIGNSGASGSKVKIWLGNSGTGGSGSESDIYVNGRILISPTMSDRAALYINGTNTSSALEIGQGIVALTYATTHYASLRIPHGTAPSSPVNGDMWTTTSGLYVRINGATIGPLGLGGSSQWVTSGSRIYYSAGSVGIGTVPSTYALEVQGSGYFTGDVFENSKSLASKYAKGEFVSYQFGLGSPGWIRIAATSSYSAYGTITISNNYYNNRPAPVTFNFGITYRNAGYITQIGGTNELISKARIVYPTATDEQYYIEVYVTTTSVNKTYYITLNDKFDVSLYTSYVAGSIPTGYASNEITFTNGIATNGIATNSINVNGTALVKGLLQAYRYSSASNLPAITMDKPGPYAYGIGPDGTYMRVRYGTASLDGSTWNLTGANGIEHYFDGNVVSTNRIDANSNSGSGGYISSGNHGGTGTAAWFPSGIYSVSVNWLYGSCYFNGTLRDNTDTKWAINANGSCVFTGYSTSWGTGYTSTGVLVNMGTSTAATWLTGGVSGGAFRGGIQLLDSGSIMRLYANTNYMQLDSSGLYYNGTQVSLVGHSHSGYEPALGNPAADSYVLISSTAGARQWVAASTIFNFYLRTDRISPYNTSVGYSIGYDTSQLANVTIGYLAQTSGSYSVAIGYNANFGGYGNENVYIGYRAGEYCYGNGNVIIGCSAYMKSSATEVNNTLAIGGAITGTPLITGNFNDHTVLINGTLTSNTEVLTLNFTNKYSGIIEYSVAARKQNKVYSMSGYFIATSGASTSTERLLCRISSYVSPGYPVYFPISIHVNQEGSSGYIDMSGNVYVLYYANTEDHKQCFNFSWMTS